MKNILRTLTNKYLFLFVLSVYLMFHSSQLNTNETKIIKHPELPATAGAINSINTSVVIDEPEPEPTYQSLGIFRVTAYCSCRKCCEAYADNRPLDEAGNPIVYGASGEVLIPEYSVAVDPKVIPYGTKLYMNGKEFVAHDKGGLIKGNSIDLYFASHKVAWDWGVQYIEVFTLAE